MKINVLTQLRETIESLIIRQTNLHKSFRNFIIETMILYITMLGKVNYTSMARISDSCESRFRQNFRQSFDWLGFNAQFTEHMREQRTAIAIDPSYISKAGKKTPGLGYFWSGCAGALKWGLEILGVALVNADAKEAVHLKAVQTIRRPKKRGPKPKHLKALTESNGLFAMYLNALHKDAKRLRSICRHVVADSFFANGPFLQGLDALGFDLISRLHGNAKMRYMYTGPQKAKGRHRKFAGRVDLDNLREDIFTTEVFVDEDGEGVALHTGEVWVDCLGRICKVVVADYLDKGRKTQTRKVYFANDRSLSGKDIFDLYRTRFQIEFLYRDGKQHMGLTHCQARSEEALDFSYNMSLSSINVLRRFARDNGYGNLSIGSMKMMMHNAFMLDRFISISGKSPKLRKNDTVFKELLFLGVRDAA